MQPKEMQVLLVDACVLLGLGQRVTLPFMPSLRDYLETCIEAAYLGGKRTLAYFNAGVEVETKSNDTPVTIADREAEAVIRQRLRRWLGRGRPRSALDY
jgi:hypothetical protein